MNDGEMAAMAAWGLDFVRAFIERPRVFKWLALLLMGRYARRELIGLTECIEKMGSFYLYNIGYGLEECGYHQDKAKWRW